MDLSKVRMESQNMKMKNLALSVGFYFLIGEKNAIRNTISGAT